VDIADGDLRALGDIAESHHALDAQDGMRLGSLDQGGIGLARMVEHSKIRIDTNTAPRVVVGHLERVALQATTSS
jgi:hypothetical protein